jgi:hypothetical protein
MPPTQMKRLIMLEADLGFWFDRSTLLCPLACVNWSTFSCRMPLGFAEPLGCRWRMLPLDVAMVALVDSATRKLDPEL